MTFTIERRNFLQKLGWSVLAIAGTSIVTRSPLSTESEPTDQGVRPGFNKEAEQWLLATGKQDIDGKLYAMIAKQIDV